MALNHSPSIVTNGLVYYHDANNVRSYVGPPIQNLSSFIGVSSTGTATGYSSTGGSEVVNVPQLGPVTTYFNNIQNNYTSFVPNSTACCVQIFNYGGFLVSPSTLYTYAIVYKCDSGYTSPNFMYRYEYNGATYVTEGGIFNNSNRIYLGDGWYWAWGTFTTQATTTQITNSASFYYQYSPYKDKVSIAKVLITPGNYTSLHPKYWPANATTRTTSNNIVDLTGTNTVTATSLTYASDGTFSFNGSSDYLSIPNTTLGNGNIAWTVSCWIKTTTTTNSLGGGSILSNISGGPVFSMMGVNNGKIVYWTYQSSNWSQKLGIGKTVNDGNWHMLTWVNYNNYTMDMYVDGILDSNVPNSTSGNNNPVDVIGRSWAGYFPGSIALLSRYNRALTAAEVLQNFNALKGRYGL